MNAAIQALAAAAQSGPLPDRVRDSDALRLPTFASVTARMSSPVGHAQAVAPAMDSISSPLIRRTSDIMKNIRIILAGAVAFAALAPISASAQSTASSSTQGSARIVQPIAITKNSDLAFGTIVRPTSGSNTVTVDQTSGTRALTGGGDAVLVTSTTSRATYTVDGEGGQTFSISVPATFTLNGSTSGTITVNLTPTATSGTLSGAVGASGTATFGVGGNFALSSTQATGNYTGSFNATVAYN